MVRGAWILIHILAIYVDNKWQNLKEREFYL